MRALWSLIRRARSWLRGKAGRRRAVWVVTAALAATWLSGLGLILGRVVTQRGEPAGGAMVIYLHAGTADNVGQALTEEVARLGGVSQTEYVSASETLLRLRRSLAGEETLLEGVEPSAMPPSIEALLQPGVEQVLPLSPTWAALRRHPAVEQVAIEEAEQDTLSIAMARLAPWALRLQFLVAGIAAWLGLAVARLGWRTPRRELAVATLLGASPAFHLVPAALAAALAAALGALGGACGLTWSAQQLAALTPGSADLLGLTELAVLVVAAMALAALAAAVAVVAREEES
ncbi:MAG TPA: permease-like cell division protein FtsX [Kofleriaceae bacterium]|nr:permease-like cell division protein FtsX [Kofleriaceae bacterium]